MSNMTCGLNVGWCKRIQNFWIRLAASITWLLPGESEAQFRVIHNNWLRAWPEYLMSQHNSSPSFRENFYDYSLSSALWVCVWAIVTRLLVPTNKPPNCIVVILIRVSFMRCERNFCCNTIVLWVDLNKVISDSRVTKPRQRPQLTLGDPSHVWQEKLCRVIGNLRLRGTQRTGGRYSIAGAGY